MWFIFFVFCFCVLCVVLLPDWHLRIILIIVIIFIIFLNFSCVLCVGYHGTSGPMKIADLQLTPLVEAFLDAGRELSYEVLDVNGPNQLGGWNWSVSVDWFICYWTPCTCSLAGNFELHSDEISSIVNPRKCRNLLGKNSRPSRFKFMNFFCLLLLSE